MARKWGMNPADTEFRRVATMANQSPGAASIAARTRPIGRGDASTWESESAKHWKWKAAWDADDGEAWLEVDYSGGQYYGITSKAIELPVPVRPKREYGVFVTSDSYTPKEKWGTNAMRYDSEEKAYQAGRDLQCRWSGCHDFEVREITVKEPPPVAPIEALVVPKEPPPAVVEFLAENKATIDYASGLSWLNAVLDHEPQAVADLKAMAAAKGIAWNTITFDSKRMESVRIDGKYHWRLK